TMMISHCWRSLLDGAERAHAQRRRSKSGSIGRGKYRRCERWPAIFSSSFSPVSPGSIANSAQKRLSSAAFIVFEVAFPGMNRLPEGKHRTRNLPTLLACLSLRCREMASEAVNQILLRIRPPQDRRIAAFRSRMYVGSGSIATEEVEATRSCISASPEGDHAIN